jgi:hydantoinase/carbamoylase family amidase
MGRLLLDCLFDGAYGVASGLEVVRRLQESKRNLKHSLEIYGFNAEESNPIGGTFGSRAITGLVDTKQAGFKEALAQYGHTPEEIAACRRNFDNAKCYLELHIEQGDLLFNEGLNIGVVSGIVGIIRYRVTAIGRSNHAGTTMMKNRKDAMVAMSKLIVAADKRCREIDDTLVLTIGTIKIWPGSENVIPGKVECTFEMRHMDKSKTDQLIADIRKFAAEIPNAQFEIEKRVDKGGVNCNPHLMEIISAAAEKVKVSHIVMPSGAGHDANPMAHRVPVGMIFVPSKNGLSHCGEEWTEAQDLENGVNVLYNTVEALDKED